MASGHVFVVAGDVTKLACDAWLLPTDAGPDRSDGAVHLDWRNRAPIEDGMKAGIYTRVSVDRDETSASPDRQRADCERLAVQRGVDVIDRYEYRDQSAYSKNAKRPEYRRLLDDARAGRIDTIIVWKLDRLTRQGLAGLNEVLETGAALISVNESLDTSTPMGEGVVGILASVAKQESFNTSLRVKRAEQAAAERGEMHTGGVRAYGYRRDGSIVEAEAEVIREAANRVLAGESFRAVAMDMNARGVTTSTGGPWHSSRLANVLRSPRLVGWRAHNGEVHEGAWAAILTVDDHRRLVDTRATPRAARTRRILLAGIIFCGRCGGHLKLGMQRRYDCVPSPGAINCGGLGISGKSVEALVVRKLLALLEAGELDPDHHERQPGRTDRQLAQDVEKDTQRLLDLHRERWSLESIEHDHYVILRSEIEERRARAQDEIERRAYERQRAAAEKYDAVHAAVEHVTVKPAVRFGSRFDPSRVTVEFDWPLLERVAGVSWLAVHDAVTEAEGVR